MKASQIKTYMNVANNHEMLDILNHIRVLDLRSIDIDELKYILSPLFIGYQSKAPEFDPAMLLFRARRDEERCFESIRDLSYPPVNETKLNRANRELSPKFYCSSSRKAVFFEINAQEGEVITIGHWRTSAQLLAHPIGYSSKIFNQLGSNRECPPYAHSDFHIDKFHKEVRDFFSEEFARKVQSGEEHLYKISVAIAERYLGKPFNAILYPSMAQYANSDNLAIEPEFTDQHIKFLYAERVRIEKKYDSKYDIKKIDFATADTTGSLIWKGRP